MIYSFRGVDNAGNGGRFYRILPRTTSEKRKLNESAVRISEAFVRSATDPENVNSSQIAHPAAFLSGGIPSISLR